MVSASTLLSNVILFIRDRLQANLTDTLSASRRGRFVMTSYPKVEVQYPVITIRGEVTGSTKLGQQSEKELVNLRVEVRIWARNEKEKNELFDEAHQFLRTNQYPTATANTSTNEQLFDFGLDSATDLDDPGEEGIKSKISLYRYIFIA